MPPDRAIGGEFTNTFIQYHLGDSPAAAGGLLKGISGKA
jgi:hypothetical protein